MERENRIRDLLTGYNSSLFTTTNPMDLDPVLNGVELQVTEGMNSKLLKPFVLAEVLSALKQMDANTAPSPDGLPPLFHKQFWEKIGREVFEAILTVLNSSTIPVSLNHTFISLIPKIQSPKKVFDFRQINLSNVLYKLIAKVLANLLKHLLPNLVLETQSAFMFDRLITNNILVTHETLHYLKERRCGKIGYVALKLDMSKAYDRVKWVYLEKIMEMMGFNKR